MRFPIPPCDRASLRGAACALPAVLMAGHAAAQSSVTLYGNVDASMVASRSGTAAVGKMSSLASGVGTASFWGMRGVEDMGGGYKAQFQLEAGLEVDSGSSKQFNGDYAQATPTAPNGPPVFGFNRRAHVGLETPVGTFLAGREYSPIFYTALATDGMRLQYFGNVQSLLSLTGGAEREARASNGVFYTSPVFSGFRGRAFYSFGSESNGGAGRPPSGANRFWGLGAEYVSPSLVMSGSYQVLRLPLTGGAPLAFTSLVNRKDWALGARYNIGAFSLAAGHFEIDAPLKGTDNWLGGSYTFGASMIATQVQRLRQDNPAGAARRATVFGVTYAYSLSKRTIVYSTYGRTNNNATAQFGVTGNDVGFAAGAPGARPSALALGVRHVF